MSKKWFSWPACIEESDWQQKGKGYFKNVCKLSVVPEHRAVSARMLFLNPVAFVAYRLYDSSKLKRK